MSSLPTSPQPRGWDGPPPTRAAHGLRRRIAAIARHALLTGLCAALSAAAGSVQAASSPLRTRDATAGADLDAARQAGDLQGAHGREGSEALTTANSSTVAPRPARNRCLGAELLAPATAADDPAGKVAGALSLWDGLEETGLALLSRPGEPITVRFVGAPKFLNRIGLLVERAGRVAVDLIGPEGEPFPDVALLEPIAPVAGAKSLGDALRRVELVVPTARYTGFRLRSPDGTAEIVLHEMTAEFVDPELSKDASEVADEWCADYPGTGNDLSAPPNTTRRFSDYLNDYGWSWTFDFGNSNAWEEDFKHASLGGTNDTWVDAADIVIYCGHGSTDQLSIARTDRDDASVLWSDATAAWGNNDLEWIWMHCCLNLVNFKFHGAMDGLHTMAGFVNVIGSASNWGQTIAQKLIDSGAFDSPWTIYQAWWAGNDSNQPAGNIGRLIAEDNGHFNEYIWGEGPVEADSPDATHWYIDQTVSKLGKDGDAWFGQGPQRTSAPVAWEAPPTLGKPGEPALHVLVHPEVLQKSLKATMPVFRADPPQMSAALAAELLQSLCATLPGGCPAVGAGTEDRDAVVANAGNRSLWGSQVSGGFHFVEMDKFLVPAVAPPNPVGPAEAARQAAQHLQALFTLPAVQELAVRTLEAVGFEERIPGQITEVARYPYAYDVVYGRMLGVPGTPMFPVLGRGGRTTMNIGAAGQLLGIASAQRNVSAVGSTQTMEVQTALDQLMAFGYNVLESPPETQATEVVVRDVNLGYFERGYLDPQTTMPPIFYMDVDLVQVGKDGEKAAVPARLYMGADAMAPRAEILQPGDGSVFPIGVAIQFVGRALGGTAPHTFRWYSSSNGQLSTLSQFSTSSLIPSTKVPGESEPEVITLEVTDANGYVSTDAISIMLAGATSAELPERHPFALVQNSPNPFNPRTTIQFSLDAPSHATLAIYDLRGRRVVKLMEGELAAGPHSRLWDSTDAGGRPVAAGVYLYRLEARGPDGTVRTLERKLTLVK